jgi:hypothetical protein
MHTPKYMELARSRCIQVSHIKKVFGSGTVARACNVHACYPSYMGGLLSETDPGQKHKTLPEK